MTSEPLCANLIERYLCARGSRYFRGQHDGEFFYVANTRPRRLHVHLEICPTHGDVLMIRVTPACFFPATDRPSQTRSTSSVSWPPLSSYRRRHSRWCATPAEGRPGRPEVSGRGSPGFAQF